MMFSNDLRSSKKLFCALTAVCLLSAASDSYGSDTYNILEDDTEASLLLKKGKKTEKWGKRIQSTARCLNKPIKLMADGALMASRAIPDPEIKYPIAIGAGVIRVVGTTPLKLAGKITENSGRKKIRKAKQNMPLLDTLELEENEHKLFLKTQAVKRRDVMLDRNKEGKLGLIKNKGYGLAEKLKVIDPDEKRDKKLVKIDEKIEKAKNRRKRNLEIQQEQLETYVQEGRLPSNKALRGKSKKECKKGVKKIKRLLKDA